MEYASAKGIWGKAMYFCESSTKADEYASPDVQGDSRVVIVCRVLGGNVYYTEDSNPKPETVASAFGHSDSVLNNREITRKTFKEFVVTHPEQILPECIVTYKSRGSIQRRTK